MSPIVESGHTDIATPRKSALAFFLLLMALYAGLGGTAQARHPVLGLAWTELFVFLLPAALVTAGSNLRPGPFLLLSRTPRTRHLLLGATAGVALFLAASGILALTSLVLPHSWVRAFDVTRLFEGSTRHQLAVALLATLAAPLAEEVAFRGYVLSALRTHLRPAAAIAASALLFAAMHLDPVRFPAVLFLGGFLGWLAWRSGSLWPAVVAHAVNNGLGSIVASGGASEAATLPTLAAALTVLAVGLGALGPLVVAWEKATPFPPDASEDRVRTDPDDPSIAFRLDRVPPGWLVLAVLGLVLYGALVLLAPAKGG
jgi:membrane protease YdiL (CAAX protease family)